MIKAGTIKNSQYHKAQIDYYTKQGDKNALDAITPLAYGALPRLAGREGQTFTSDDWEKLSLGYNPYAPTWKDAPLNKNPTKLSPEGRPQSASEQEPDRRDCLELIISTDKSYSIWAAAQSVERQERVMQLQNEVIRDHVLPLLRQFALCADGTHKYHADDFSFVSWFNHIENRNVEPFQHVHLCIKNSVMLNGKLYALENEEIFANMALVDSVFQIRLKESLEREFNLGFSAHITKVDERNEHLDQTEKNVFGWKIHGVPEFISQHYSRRSDEIEAAVKEAGVSGHQAKEIAQVATREQKTELSAKELRAQWLAEINAMGFNEEVAARDCRFNGHAPVPSDDELLEALHRRTNEICFTESQFKAAMIKNLMFSMPTDAVMAKADELFEKYCVALLEPKNSKLFEKLSTETDPHEYQELQTKLGLEIRYTTTKYLEMEQRVDRDFRLRKDERAHRLKPADVARQVTDFQAAQPQSCDGKRFAFSTDQLNAILAVTTRPGGLVGIKGAPGSGKSTLLKAVKEIYQSHGFDVIGTATSAQATSELKKSAELDAAYNVTELLKRIENSGLQLKKNDVIFWDEMAMSSTKEIHDLTRHINDAGAKLIGCGDSDQLQAVGAGGLFRHLTQEFVSVNVTTINRQRESVHREMVSDFGAGNSYDGIAKLHSEGLITVTQTTRERIDRLAADFLADPTHVKEKIIIASLNSDADAINRAVQKKLLEKGTLHQDGRVTVQGTDDIYRDFHLGERVVFFKNTKSDDYHVKAKASNSETGTLVNVLKNRKGESTAVVIELDGGKELTIGMEKARNLRLGSCVTTYKSQGATKNNSYVFASTTMNSLHTAYVQLSRHRHKTRLYLSEDMIAPLAADQRLKEPSTKSLAWATDLIAKDLSAGRLTHDEAAKKHEQVKTFQGCRRYLNSHPGAYKAEPGSSIQKIKESQTISEFIDVFKAMGQRNYKKTTFDMKVLSSHDLEKVKLPEIRLRKQQGMGMAM